jgi:hypothetical protein
VKIRMTSSFAQTPFLAARFTLGAICLAVLVTAVVALPAAAQDQEKENFEALAVHLGTGPSGIRAPACAMRASSSATASAS